MRLYIQIPAWLGSGLLYSFLDRYEGNYISMLLYKGRSRDIR